MPEKPRFALSDLAELHTKNRQLQEQLRVKDALWEDDRRNLVALYQEAQTENEQLQRQLLSSTPGLRIHELEAENKRLTEKLKRWEAIDLGKTDAVIDLQSEVERLKQLLWEHGVEDV